MVIDWTKMITTADKFVALKESKKREIANARYTAETGGVTIDDMRIATDRDSQSLITGAALAATMDSGYTLNWKTVSGFVELTAAQIIAVAQAVRAHVQICFDIEATLMPQIEAATDEETLNNIVWPTTEEQEESFEETS